MQSFFGKLAIRQLYQLVSDQFPFVLAHPLLQISPVTINLPRFFSTGVRLERGVWASSRKQHLGQVSGQGYPSLNIPSMRFPSASFPSVKLLFSLPPIVYGSCLSR